MGKINVKKIIAREGLVILGIVCVACLIFIASTVYPPMPKPVDYYAGLNQAEKNSIKELMALRDKYPEYNDLDNLALAELLADKYPQYQTMLTNIKLINERNKNKKNGFDVSTAKPFEQNIPTLESVKRNVAKMVERNAPEIEIDKYILSQGFTIEDVHNYKLPKRDIFDEIESERQPRDLLVELTEKDRAKISGFGLYTLLLGYPLYLLIRFIFWAIKTLKQKE